MSPSARQLIAAATRGIARDSLRLEKYNAERYGVARRPKPVFNQQEQVKRTAELAHFDKVLPQPLGSFPPGVVWASLERRVMARRERTCAVCLDVLGRGEVILCSCGHVFHATCVAQSCHAQACPMCKAPVFFNHSQALATFFAALAALTIQTAARRRAAQRKTHARRLIASGALASSMNEVQVASDRLTKEAIYITNAAYAEGLHQADEASRAFDALMRMRDTRSWEVVEKARRRSGTHAAAQLCPVCLEQLPRTIIATCAEQEAYFVVVSCCGSLYHKQCIAEAEKTMDACAYCRAAYYGVFVEAV